MFAARRTQLCTEYQTILAIGVDTQQTAMLLRNPAEDNCIHPALFPA